MNGAIADKRNTCVDLTKTTAIIFVIIIHSTSPVLWETFGSFPWLSGLFWGSVSRSAVPLFLMCSGVLFLSPERKLSVRKLYTRTLPRILVALFVWASIYKIWRLIKDGGGCIKGVVLRISCSYHDP
ncbi:MAG: acyltransferase family protein [Clostridia bacterium]|nr:acyltransferase family protein [Clostridia bacterium]